MIVRPLRRCGCAARREPTMEDEYDMKLGVVFPQTEIGSDPAVIRDYAQAAEGAGYDHLLVFDHVLGAKLERFDKLGRRPCAPGVVVAIEEGELLLAPPVASCVQTEPSPHGELSWPLDATARLAPLP